MEEKEIQIARVIEEFRKDKLTGRLELDFKNGELMGGRKQVSFLR